MAQIVRTETRKRGFFGWIVKILFIAFNLLMLAWLIFGIGVGSEEIEAGASEAYQEAYRTGETIGATIAIGVILTFWVLGDIILGLLVILTRGKKVIVETHTN